VSSAFAEEDPIVQMTMDESRRILYTRSEKGTIQVYDLGLDGNSFNWIASLKANAIVQSAANIARCILCFYQLF